MFTELYQDIDLAVIFMSILCRSIYLCLTMHILLLIYSCFFNVKKYPCVITSQSKYLRILPMDQTIPSHLFMALTVISANIEGLTTFKVSILSEMCKREHCHGLSLQETHRPTNLRRPNTAGMSIGAERPVKRYGSLRNDLKVENVYDRVK